MKTVLGVICSFFLVVVTWGQVTAELLTSVNDLQRILAQKKLTVALIESDYPPLFTTNSTGHLSGRDITRVQDIAAELGVEVEFNRAAHSFDDIIDLVSKGEADMGVATSITLSRAKKVLFSQPYLTLNMALLINRLKGIQAGIPSKLRGIEGLRETTQAIGLLTGSAYKTYAQTKFPKAELKEYRTLSDLITAVEQGEVLAAVRNDLTARRHLTIHPEAVLKLQLVVDEAAKDPIAFAVRPDSPHLLFWLNTYLLLKTSLQ